MSKTYNPTKNLIKALGHVGDKTKVKMFYEGASGATELALFIWEYDKDKDLLTIELAPLAIALGIDKNMGQMTDIRDKNDKLPKDCIASG